MNVQCQCGAIRFQTPLPKPLAVYICHCDECRRQSSSAFGCSAIFPKFELPGKRGKGKEGGGQRGLSCYSRPTSSGHQLNCYFCTNCGTRLIHSTPGKDVVSVKGGCIEGLDWSTARHIWCKRAMIPIPEGVERDEEEPADETYGDMSMSDGGDDRRSRARLVEGSTICPELKIESSQAKDREKVTLKRGEEEDEIRG
ncbi:uncharacterized protein LY89DRAFT_25017 [Mollisia scopiformis]|uniref:CENP-V/GFA domain-containing protein n=1 Tax=Mollisia scopiformis TaxID=149040 RepID=A0A194XX00_MOLSC|nr:uncharacterized protein LY89DRAFT_25017 [Mollisia scopiformis]KUJ24589.1 hypothetical protein LY89DRAFT_25017 [Mollisia scopiformis]